MPNYLLDYLLDVNQICNYILKYFFPQKPNFSLSNHAIVGRAYLWETNPERGKEP